MSVFTLRQYEDLLAIIASGAQSVSYDGKSVSNRSLADLLFLLNKMGDDLGVTPRRSSTILAAHDRGFIGGNEAADDTLISGY